MVLLGGMQQESDKILNEFLDQLKGHFDQQNATLAEYEQFFVQIQKAFPIYADFVEQVNQSLSAIQNKKHEARVVRSTESKKIIIVDDSEINRILLGHFFKNMPVVLEFASSGDQAIEKTNQNSFDLILMDLQMKGMSGMDAIKAIREAQPENAKKTLILAISNQEPSEDERIQVMSLGANDYLTKSMSRELMKERVFEVLFGQGQISA